MKMSKTKIATLAIIAALIACLAGFAGIDANIACADGPVGISVTNNTTHRYYASQVFAGTPVTDNGVNKLVVEDWGIAVEDPGELVSDLKADATIGSLFADVPAYDSGNPAVSARAVARIVADLGITKQSDSAEAHALLDVLAANLDDANSKRTIIFPVSTAVTLPNGYGYYMLQTSSVENDAAEIASLLIVDADGLVIEGKTSEPTLTKLVAWEDVSTGEVLAWQKSATSDATVMVKLIATMPKNVANLQMLDYEVADLLVDDNLVIDPSRVSFKLVNGDSSVPLTNAYVTGRQYSGTSEDMYTYPYPKATVFRIDVDGLAADPAFDVNDDSTIEISYTANIADAVLDSDHSLTSSAILKYNSHSYGEVSTGYYEGKTPLASIEVIRPKLEVAKTDKDNTPLPGAKFGLYTVDGSGAETLVREYTYEQPTDPNAALTTFSFYNLGDGRYILRELATPDDTVYELMDPIQFETHSGYDDSESLVTCDVMDWEGEYRRDIAVMVTSAVGNKTVSMSTSVINWRIGEAPIELPETGGIGTTAFYAIGTILVLGAGIVLVTRKRSQRHTGKRG